MQRREMHICALLTAQASRMEGLTLCACAQDWVLASVFRATSGFQGEAAGLAPVSCPGVENVNLSSLVGGHFDYLEHGSEVLDVLGLYA